MTCAGTVAEQGSRQVVVSHRGGTDSLALQPLDLAPPGRGQVQIRVRAAGVAFGDIALREGLRPDRHYPATPGYDVAGVVQAVGPDVKEVQVGTAVAAWTGGFGGYADLVNVPDWAFAAYPVGLDP